MLSCFTDRIDTQKWLPEKPEAERWPHLEGLKEKDMHQKHRQEGKVQPHLPHSCASFHNSLTSYEVIHICQFSKCTCLMLKITWRS